MLLYVLRGLLLCRPSDFADHDNRVSSRIFIEKPDRVDKARTNNGITAYANARGLPNAPLRELPYGFVGESAAARNQSNPSRFVNETGHDADLALTGRNNPGAIRTDHADIVSYQVIIDANHVLCGDALCDGDDEFDSRFRGFKNRPRRRSGRYEDDGCVGFPSLHGLCNRIEHRNGSENLSVSFP